MGTKAKLVICTTSADDVGKVPRKLLVGALSQEVIAVSLCKVQAIAPVISHP